MLPVNVCVEALGTDNGHYCENSNTVVMSEARGCDKLRKREAALRISHCTVTTSEDAKENS